MTYDWKTLAPHRPLDPDEAGYVVSPSGGAQEIVDWVLAGRSTLLVGGPTGVGKSTELARAATLLKDKRVGCFLPLDRSENMRRLTPERLLRAIVATAVQVSLQALERPPSEALRFAVLQAGVLGRDELQLGAPTHAQDEHARISSPQSAAELARNALNEIARLSPSGRVTLLIDGLEKVPDGPGSLELFDALGALPECADLVLVVPWHAAFGPRSEQVLRPDERFLMLRAPDVDRDGGAPGREFLRQILLARAPVPDESGDPQSEAGRAAYANVVNEAARLSGGIPRIFLQLVADAGTYAQLRRKEEWPDESDLASARADQEDSFRRILLPGDGAAIHAVAGSDGRELDLARKVRLMANGVVLERLRDRKPVVEIHPLVRSLVYGGNA